MGDTFKVYFLLFLNFNFILSGFSHGYSVARNVFFDHLRTVVSPKQGVEMHLSFSELICSNSVFLVVADKSILDTFYVIYKALRFDVAQGRMNGAPNETRTHSCRSASLAC